MQIKLTKNELRAQQVRLTQLQKYLPTLQLKKAMLQTESFDAKMEWQAREKDKEEMDEAVEHFAALLNERMALDVTTVAQVSRVDKSYENIAGVEIPTLQGVEFEPVTYSLFDTPPWLEAAVAKLQEQVVAEKRVEVAREKHAALEHELRQVSIRVNLFEKVLIPRAEANIKKIKVFLGDQELAAVSQAKVAKEKIIMRKAGAKRR